LHGAQQQCVSQKAWLAAWLSSLSLWTPALWTGQPAGLLVRALGVPARKDVGLLHLKQALPLCQEPRSSLHTASRHASCATRVHSRGVVRTFSSVQRRLPRQNAKSLHTCQTVNCRRSCMHCDAYCCPAGTRHAHADVLMHVAQGSGFNDQSAHALLPSRPVLCAVSNGRQSRGRHQHTTQCSSPACVQRVVRTTTPYR
jgi:hypothetical protein